MQTGLHSSQSAAHDECMHEDKRTHAHIITHLQSSQSASHDEYMHENKRIHAHIITHLQSSQSAAHDGCMCEHKNVPTILCRMRLEDVFELVDLLLVDEDLVRGPLSRPAFVFMCMCIMYVCVCVCIYISMAYVVYIVCMHVHAYILGSVKCQYFTYALSD